MNPRTSDPYDEDIDDIMASIMQGQASNQVPTLRIKQPNKIRRSRKISHKTSSVNTSPESLPSIKPKSRPKQPRERRRPIKPTILALAFSGLLIGGLLIARGPLSSLLTQPGPFSAEIKSNMKIPLYYPAKLPGSYKIELGSIAQPEPSVLVYSASDDNGDKINFSLQKKPSGLTLEPLYKVLSDTKNVDTKFGVVVYGASEDNLDIANVVADESWLIITSKKDLLKPSDIQTLVNSLKIP